MKIETEKKFFYLFPKVSYKNKVLLLAWLWLKVEFDWNQKDIFDVSYKPQNPWG